MSRLKNTVGSMLPAMRISISLVLLTTCILLSAEMLGFTPSQDKFLLESRAKISESLAIQFSVLSPDRDIKKIQKLIRYIVKRNDDILSAGIRSASGQLMFQSGNHADLWQDYHVGKSTAAYVVIPFMLNGQLWGNVEFRFNELKSESLWGFFTQPIFKLSAFVLFIGFFVFLVFMLRTLRQLDPSAVIPDRVNTAFDTLAEGIMIIDEQEHILLTNKAFSEKIGRPLSSLMGVKVSELKWERVSKQKSGSEYPWVEALKSGKNSIGAQLIFKTEANQTIKFAINASPIIGDNNKLQGVLITLDDISQLEERNTELQTIVSRLEKTQVQVQQQNKELSYLATRDPLTGCLNRRSFSEQFDKLFKAAGTANTELSCIMVDIDHFKAVNDNYGHAIGDVVIKILADVLQANTRKNDLVARYGGEEFCLTLPGMSAEDAIGVAERIRLRIKAETIEQFENGPRVTASLGVASMLDKPENPDALVNLADSALYIAKESGRNRVVRWQADNENNQTLSNHQTEVFEDSAQQPEHRSVETLQNRITELETIASQFSADLEYNKSYDVLTGLPNQVLFYDRINQAIERGVRHDQLAAVLVIDIEMFSQINSTLGRAAGDRLLQEMAERLNIITRKSDGVSRLTVSRFTGDEFAVLFTDLAQKEQVTWAVKRLLDAVNQPVDIEGNTVYPSCHVGISLYPSDADTVDDLLNNAMTAKQYSKNHKENFNYQFFDQHMQDLSIKHMTLDKELRQSIEQDNWALLYQPKQDIKSGSIVGAEALIRWQHPQRGLLSPFEFIDFAEQRGLINGIGDWVIKETCRQIREWMDQGINECRVAINLSGSQLIQPEIVNKIFDRLEEFKVPPRLLEIEITETTLMDNIQIAMESLKRLNARGIRISIDDFGTGYSSLSYLKNLPINCLKIDRSFVKDICQDDNDKKIVQTLISMAHSMDMLVVAEGVEEQDQFDLLDQYSCDEIQGYLLSKPVAADLFLDMLKSSKQAEIPVQKKLA